MFENKLKVLKTQGHLIKSICEEKSGLIGNQITRHLDYQYFENKYQSRMKN